MPSRLEEFADRFGEATKALGHRVEAGLHEVEAGLKRLPKEIDEDFRKIEAHLKEGLDAFQGFKRGVLARVDDLCTEARASIETGFDSVAELAQRPDTHGNRASVVKSDATGTFEQTETKTTFGGLRLPPGHVQTVKADLKAPEDGMFRAGCETLLTGMEETCRAPGGPQEAYGALYGFAMEIERREPYVLDLTKVELFSLLLSHHAASLWMHGCEQPSAPHFNAIVIELRTTVIAWRGVQVLG